MTSDDILPRAEVCKPWKVSEMLQNLKDSVLALFDIFVIELMNNKAKEENLLKSLSFVHGLQNLLCAVDDCPGWKAH